MVAAQVEMGWDCYRLSRGRFIHGWEAMVFCAEAVQKIGQTIYASSHQGSFAESSAILEQARKAYPSSTCFVIGLRRFKY